MEHKEFALKIEGQILDAATLRVTLLDSAAYMAAFPGMFKDLPVDEPVNVVDCELYTCTIQRVK